MLNTNKSEPYRGIVDGILSGDSLIIRFLPPCPTPIQIVSLEHLVAPKYGNSDGKISDEPHGFESWNFLRNLCIGRRVTIPSRAKIYQGNTRLHLAFGNLPIVFTRVSLYDEERSQKDIGLLCVKAGMLKLREKVGNDQFVHTYAAAQEEAMKAEIGIWSKTPGYVRQMPVEYYEEDLLDQKEFDAIVEGVFCGTTLSLFLQPRQEQIIMQIAGIRSYPSKKQSDPNSPGPIAKETTLRKFLHRTIRVRICQAIPKQREDSYIKSYVGCILGDPDHAMVNLIKEGLAQFNQKTADFAPNADSYVTAELAAREKKIGIWATDLHHFELRPLADFEGKVIMIRSSNSLYISNGSESRLFYLNGVKVPYFYYNNGGGADPLGFDAREFLRTRYVGQNVRVVHEGTYQYRDYATIYHGKNCINEEICRAGLARYVDPVTGKTSERATQIRAAENDARAKKLGLFAANIPEPLHITNLSNSTNKKRTLEFFERIRNQKLDAIIEHVSPGNKFHILIPSRGLFIRSGVDGLLPYPANDAYGILSKQYCQDHFLQANIEICPSEVDKYSFFFSSITIKTFYNQVFNLAENLIENGLAEVHNKLLKSNTVPANFIAQQRNAAAKGVGVWADKTRHNHELVKGKVERVKVISIWNPITYAIQFLREGEPSLIDVIDEALRKDLVKIAPDEIQNLHRNQCIVAKYNNQLFRARIESFTDKENTQINEVKFIDYLISNTTVTEFYYLPEELLNIEPQARAVKLCCMELPKDMEEDEQKISQACNDLWQSCNDVILFLHVVYEDENPNVLLTDHENADSGSLNSFIISVKRYANFVDHEVPEEFANIKAMLKPVEEGGEFQS